MCCPRRAKARQPGPDKQGGPPCVGWLFGAMTLAPALDPRARRCPCLVPMMRGVFFLGWEQGPVIVACPDGGTSIEDLAESNPELILKVLARETSFGVALREGVRNQNQRCNQPIGWPRPRV